MKEQWTVKAGMLEKRKVTRWHVCKPKQRGFMVADEQEAKRLSQHLNLMEMPRLVEWEELRAALQESHRQINKLVLMCAAMTMEELPGRDEVNAMTDRHELLLERAQWRCQ